MALKKQVVQRDHSQDLDSELTRINASIANLYALAEVADPKNKDSMLALQQRLIALEHERREIEGLISGVTNQEAKEKKLLAALDKFEKWCESQRPFLDNPAYVPSQKDKIAALLILGVKVIVWPASEEYEERIKYTLLPPDIKRCMGEFCDFVFDKP